MQPVVLAELDEHHALARAREVVHLLDAADHRPALLADGQQGLVAVDLLDADDLRALGRPGVLSGRRGCSARRTARHRTAARSRRWSRRPRASPGRASGCFGSSAMSPIARGSIAVGGDDPLAVLELEQLLDRLAVAGGSGDVDDPAGVGRRRSSRRTSIVARVDPASQASTRSPSRRRVLPGSLISRCRLIQPSAVTSTCASSATIKSSAENSGSSSWRLDLRPPLVVFLARSRLALDLFDLVADDAPPARIEVLLVRQQLLDLADAASSSSFSSSRTRLISSLARRYSFSSRMASVCSASSCLNFAMIFFAASALPSLRADDPDDLVQRIEDQRKTFEDVRPLL